MAHAETKKILVVDDEPDAIGYVTAALGEAGFQVISAPNGVEGLAKARSEKPDLVILDVQMPQKDGFSTFVEMRKDDALGAIPIIMLTGIGERLGMHVSAADMGKYFGKEPDAYVDKPVDAEALLRTVRRLLDLGE